MATKTIRVVLEALTAQYQASMRAATVSTSQFGLASMASINASRQAFTTLGLGATALAGTIGFAMKQAADAAIEFESSFAGVRKTVEASEAGFAVLEQGMRDLALTIPVNVNELNRIGEAAGQLGIQGNAILGFTETVAKLGVTTQLTSDEAAVALARIANIMGTASEDFNRLGSSVVALGNAGASTEPEIVDFSLRIAGAGKLAGLTEAEVLGLANAFLSLGIPVESGGTAVQKAILGIISAVATGGEKLELFAATSGMSAERFAEAWRSDPAMAFVAFVEGLGRSGEQGIRILQELFGVNERVARTFLSAAQNSDLLRESIDLGNSSWAESNALNEEAAKRFETTASQAQLAANEINDMAIGFGQLLLPAVALAAGALGDIAGLIGDLPGPAKAVALAIAGIVAAMAALSGATLLLLPRVAAAKAALVEMGHSSSLLRGGFQSVISAINPWTIAIGAATVGLGIWAQKHAEAKQRVEELTAAIKADSGAIGENTRALVVNRLEEEGILQAAQEFGLALDVVTDAALGSESAIATVTTALGTQGFQLDDLNEIQLAYRGSTELSESANLEMARAADVLSGAVTGTNDDLAAATDSAKRQAEALGQDEEAAQGTTGALAGMPPVLDDVAGGMEEAASAGEELQEVLEGIAGTALDAEEASLEWLDALAGLNRELTHAVDKNGDLTNALKPGVKGLNDQTEAGREARRAILSAANAALEHGQAVAEQSGSVERGARVVQQHIKALEVQAIEAGISERAIREYIRELNLTPREIRTAIKLFGAEKAKADIRSIGEAIAALPSEKRVNITVSRTEAGRMHAGGPVRLHSGGLASNEVPAILQRGEWVTDARTASRHERLLAALPRLHAGGRAGGGGESLIGPNFLERQFGRLEQALERAAEIAKEATSRGADLTHLDLKELTAAVNQRQKELGEKLDDAREHLAKIRERIQVFSEAIRSGFAGPGDLVSGAMAGFGTPPEGFPAGVFFGDIGGFLAEQLTESRAFADALRRLSGMGLDARILAQIAAQGPEALPFIQALLSGGQELIAEFNATADAINKIAAKTSESLTMQQFGDQVDDAREKLARLGQRVSDVMDRLEIRLLRFLDSVQVNLTAKKFDDLNRAIDQLSTSFFALPRNFAGVGGVVVNVDVKGNVWETHKLAVAVRDEFVKIRDRNAGLGV
jgi:TP901 family phage tail tape measure protein